MLSACASAPRRPARPELPPPPPTAVPDAVPRAEARSSHGNPRSYEVNGRRYTVLASADSYLERGVASWYGPDFHGHNTSSGERYDMYAMTAAHRTLPIPCYARVTNLANGRSVVVRINDRGPFVANRIVDLSYSAATRLDIVRTGTAFVELRTIGSGDAPLEAAAPAATEPEPVASAGCALHPGGRVCRPRQRAARARPAAVERRTARVLAREQRHRAARCAGCASARSPRSRSSTSWRRAWRRSATPRRNSPMIEAGRYTAHCLATPMRSPRAAGDLLMKSSLARFMGIFLTLYATVLAAASGAQLAAPMAPPLAAPPVIEARSWVLVDFASGQALAAGNADQRVEPASLTKLMSAYVIFDALRGGRLKMNEPVMISEHAWHAEGSRTFVQVGTRVPVEVLIKGMIVQSGNDATIALAERVGGSEPAFVQMMNGYAQRLGMTGTHFADASGLPSPSHYSTARDLATLSRAIIRDFPEYYGLYSLREFTWNNIRQENRNGLLERDASVDGLKTGHTETAGYCLISSALRSGLRLVAVVLGTRSVSARESASAALLNYGYDFYESVTVKKGGEMVLKPRVYKGAEQFIAVATSAAVQVTVPRGQGTTVTTRASVRGPLLAPLAAGTAVGELQVDVAGKTVARVPLYPVAAVAAGGLWRRMIDTISLWF